MNNLFNNQNLNQNNILLRGNLEQLSINHIKQLYIQIQQCLKAQQLHAALNIQNIQYRQIIGTMDQCAKIQSNIVTDEEFSREVRERCIKIKRDNDAIMIMMFNFKELMSKINGASLEIDMAKQNQYLAIQEKVRKTKIEIVNKLQKIKASRNSKNVKSKSLSTEAKRKNLPVMNLALTQLKDAVQIVNKQLIRQKSQIKQLVKYLYQTDI